MPTKLQMTAGPNTAHTTLASRWSLASSSTTTATAAASAAPAIAAARLSQRMLVGVHPPEWSQAADRVS